MTYFVKAGGPKNAPKPHESVVKTSVSTSLQTAMVDPSTNWDIPPDFGPKKSDEAK